MGLVDREKERGWRWRGWGLGMRTLWIGKEFAFYSGAMRSHWKVSSRKSYMITLTVFEDPWGCGEGP